MADKAAFDPKSYLMKVSGKDYLPVQGRLVWLREAHPEAVIETVLVDREPVQRGDKLFAGATFRARVELPSGAVATAYGSESSNDFADYLEKAETKALGRALAHLGFGTAFANELDEGTRIVDAPAMRRPEPLRPAPKPPAAAPSDKPTAGKLKYLAQEANAAGMSADDVEARALLMFQHELAEITTGEYEDLLKWVKAKRGEAVGVR